VEGAGEAEHEPGWPHLPAIRFTAADVGANRRGELSVDQQIRLDEIAGGRTRWATWMTKWTVGGLVVLLGVGLANELRKGDVPPFALLSFGTVVLFLAGAVVVSYRTSRGLPDRRVLTTEGLAQHVVERRRYSVHGGWYTAYELHLPSGTRRRTFPFNDQASLDAVPAGQWLRVNYLELKPYPMILSYEVVPGR
jgi:hypothetical protein